MGEVGDEQGSGQGNGQGSGQYSEGRYRRVPTAQIDELTVELRGVRESLIRLEGKVAPREYVDAQDDKRVLKDVYAVDIASLQGQLTRLETHWSRVVPWLALVLSALVVLIQMGALR